MRIDTKFQNKGGKMETIKVSNGNSEIEFPVHILKDGRKIAITSKHSFKFSDGTEFRLPEDFPLDFVDALTVQREFRNIPEALPNKASESVQKLSDSSLKILRELKLKVDIVLVSFMIISALKEMGIRDNFSAVLAMNSTPETAREVPEKKVVDIDNWAW